MPKRNSLLCALFLIILLSSCSNSLKERVEGDWYINEMDYSDRNITNNLLSNGMTLYVHDSCFLPSIYVVDNHTINEKGTWKVFKQGSDTMIEFITTNQIMRGLFKIKRTWMEPDKIGGGLNVWMILVSDKLKIKCYKVPTATLF